MINIFSVKRNRLVDIFKKCANRYGLRWKQENKAWALDIPVNKKLVHARFTFDESENSYEFGAPLAQVDEENRAKFAQNILNSEPVRGITERIVGDKFYILGSKDGLSYLPDEEVENSFKDDIYRIAEYFRGLHQVVDLN